MRVSLVLKSVTATWVAVLTTALVAIFLTPLILHRLGDEAYGLWVLIVALTDYYLFLGVGIRSAVVRYVSRNLALNDRESVNQIAATAFYFFTAVCLFVVLGTVGLAPFVPKFFSVQGQYVAAVVALFVLAGIAQGLDFPLSVFEGTLEALGRFDLLYGVRILGQLLRAVFVVWVLNWGGGLYAVGAATVLSTLVPRMLVVPLAFRQVHGLSLNPRWTGLETLKQMLRYGFVSFSVGLGQRFKTSLYPLVIAKLLSASAVTLFALPMKILSLPVGGIGNMTEFINPLSSQLEAKQDYRKLGQVLLLSIQAAFLILAPLAVLCIVLGRELLTVWVGTAYTSAYPILILLTFGLGADATQCCAQSMMFGIGRHKSLVWFRAAEGLSILGLGIVLVQIWGVRGFALATAVPLLITSMVLIPRRLCQIVGLPLRNYLVEGCLKPCILALPMAATLVALRPLYAIPTWTSLIVASLVACMIYFLTLVLVTFGHRRTLFAWFSLGVLDTLQEKLFRRQRAFEVPGRAEEVAGREVEGGAWAAPRKDIVLARDED